MLGWPRRRGNRAKVENLWSKTSLATWGAAEWTDEGRHEMTDAYTSGVFTSLGKFGNRLAKISGLGFWPLIDSLIDRVHESREFC